MKHIVFFTAAVIISLVAATYRWGDSAHSIGLIRALGGEAKHPSFLESGNDRYALITTATVLPPYRGDAKIVLEGSPAMAYEIYSSGPVIDFHARRRPVLKDSILYDLRPKDRIALWVMMYPPVVDPVCGMAYEEGFIRHAYKGKEYRFCGEGCLKAFKDDPERYRGMSQGRGKYTLAFNDTTTGASLLRVPVIFKGKGDADHAGAHHH